jgi:hypothetical protein
MRDAEAPEGGLESFLFRDALRRVSGPGTRCASRVGVLCLLFGHMQRLDWRPRSSRVTTRPGGAFICGLPLSPEVVVTGHHGSLSLHGDESAALGRRDGQAEGGAFAVVTCRI